MSTVDLFWPLDPLPLTGKDAMSYDHWKTTEPHQVATRDRDFDTPEPAKDKCELCWCPAYGSFPGHVFCREHFMEHQAKVIAEITARAQRRAS